MAKTLKELYASKPQDLDFIAWIPTASDEDLREFAATMVHNARLYQRAIMEMDERHHLALKEPHWTTTPAFIAIILTMLFAGIAAWPVVEEWIRPSEHANKAANSQQQQSNSIPSMPPQTSPPVSSSEPKRSH